MFTLSSADRRLCTAVDRVVGHCRQSRMSLRHRRLAPMESLEARMLLAAVAWDGGGDGTSWVDPLNWSTNVLPTVADDVTIDLAESDPTIRLTSGSRAVHSLVSTESLEMTGGSLAVGSTAQFGKALTLSNGSLIGGTWSGPGGIVAGDRGGILNGVRLETAVTIGGGRSLTVLNGLTLNSTLTLEGACPTLHFTDGQTLGGSGQVVMAGQNALIIERKGGMAEGHLIIGPEITIRAQQNGSIRAYYGDNRVTNQGRIVADGAEVTLTLSGNQVNQGRVEARNGGTVDMVDTIAFAAAGTFDSTGGTVKVTGMLDLEGHTLALTEVTGSLVVDNYGTIARGRITTSGGARLICRNGMLDGVALACDLELNSGDSLRVANGLQLNGTLTATSGEWPVKMHFVGAQSLGGTGQIILAGTDQRPPVEVYVESQATPGLLTIGPGLTILARHEATWRGGGGQDTWINQGTIRAEGEQVTLTLDGANWANQGRIEARNGASIELDGTFTTAGLGGFDSHGGTVMVTGTLENAGATLALTDATGPLILGTSLAGIIHGGRITTSGEAALVVKRGSLNGATLDGEAVVSGVNAELTVLNGMTLNGTLTLDGGSGTASVKFDQGQTLAGTGRVVMAGHYSSAVLYGDTTQESELVIGAGITIQVRHNGQIRGYYGGDRVTVKGLVEVAAGATLEARQRVSLNLAEDAGLSIQQGGAVELGGDLAGATENSSHYRPEGKILLNDGTAADTLQRLEAMGQDVGAVADGLRNNFAYGSIELAYTGHLQLVDEFDNVPGAADEAVYVNSLVVPAQALLELNGVRLYARTASIVGQVLGGSVIMIPDSGPIAANQPTTGIISKSGEVDEWTFYGRGGRDVTVVVNPGSGALPYLKYAQVQLLDARDQVLASGSSASFGQAVSLSAVTIPSDGVYRVRVQAAANHASEAGNYTIAVWDATLDATPLVLNQQMAGRIETPCSVDRWTFSASAGQQVKLDLVSATSAGLAFSLNGPDGWSGFADVVGDSALVSLPASGVYVLTAHGTGSAYNIAYAFRLVETAQTDLALGVPYSGTLTGSGQAQLFRVEVPTTTSMRIVLDDTSAADHTELYAKFGTPPTRGDYQYRSAAGADQEVVVPWATAGTWYILVYGNTVRQPSDYVLTAIGSEMLVTSVSPDHLGNGAAMTLTLQGAGFDSTSTVQLVSGGAVYSAAGVSHDSLTRMRATFAAGSVPPGQYTVRVMQQDGATAELPGAFAVSAGGEAKLNVNLVIPSSLGYHIADTIYVEYANTGTLAMAAPLLVLDVTQNGRHGARMTLDSDRAARDYWTSSNVDSFSDSLEFLAMGKTPGVLLPGESVRVPVYWAGWEGTWDMSYPPFQFRVMSIYADDPQPIDWPALREQLRPAAISQEAWEGLYSNLTSQMGGTWGDYVRMLDENASYLAQLGEQVTDVASLYRFELKQANAFDFSGPLCETADTSIEAPGLEIGFTRWFSSSITGRYRSGMLGRGWYSQWEMALTKSSDGTVAISRPDGTLRVFKPDSRGGYLAMGIGDHGQLTDLHAAGFLLRESDGTLYAFGTDGRLSYVEDTNGNRITCGYDGELLTSLTHSAGRSLTLAYNPAGRLASITDSFDRQTLFFYDVSNQHLLSVRDTQGRVTRYEYVTGQGAAAEHALREIEHPGNTHEFLAYDAEGRLARTWRDGDAEVMTYTYDSTGTVTMTDALGGVSRVSYDNRALPLKLENELGGRMRLAFDVQANLVSLADAEGRPVTFTYDRRGNILSVTDALGNTTRFSYSSSLNRLTSITDAIAQRTEFAYDSHGNLVLQTWADGSQETWAYNSLGLPLQQSIAQGHGISYVYDADGRVTRKDYADGSHVEYAYDAHGNLAGTTDASGLTSYAYDALDQLVRIDYPGGQWLAFTYDDAGRRATSNDQSDHLLTYQYDAAGRLAGLTDSAGATIVHYTFDAIGRLARQDLANGLYTTWDYNAAGNLLHLVNHAADGSVVSRFDYTYDSSGRCTSMATLAGDWSYQYDDNGQLIGAVFASRKAEVANQDLRYFYDAAGNRTQIVASSSPVSCSGNALDQYTVVGETTYAYDANGNLIRESGPAGETTYGYDDENRLVSIASPQGMWQLTYDALGNLVASSKDGVRTEFVVDPAGLGDRVAEYSSTGELLRHYDYAAGLIRMTQGPSAFYYMADGLGSTSELIGADGTVANSYVYGPFGTVLFGTERVDNPFQWIGGWGVAQVGALSYMRARVYSASLGRFMSRDPLGLDGDGPNPYTYAGNSPVDWLDPAGTTYSHRKYAGDKPGPGWGQTSQYNQYCQEQMQFWQAMRDAWAMTDWGLSMLSPAKRQAEMLWEFFTSSAGSEDPNEKNGPAGYGTQHFVQAGSLLAYRVDFENDATATAPAQYVTVTDQLDPNIDWETFSFTQFGFGGRVIDVAPDSQHFEAAVPMSFNGRDFEVQVRGDIDLSQGRVRVEFQSIDPTTGLPPTGMTGFLPPEDGTGRGMGYFTYIARPKASLATGTQIRNVAIIQFDLGETIATNQVNPHDPSEGVDPAKECLNTIDAGAPVSHVLALPATIQGGEFTVNWSGQDDAGGSGIASYDIYVSDNGGPSTLWLDNTAASSASFDGLVGHTYAFYSLAMDHVGNREAQPIAPDATTATELPPKVQFASATYTVSEKQKVATITVTRSGDLSKAVTVAYATGKGTAKPKVQYKPISGTLTFAAGQTTRTFSIPIFNDGVAQVNKTVNLVLSRPGQGAVLGIQSRAVLTISDNNDRTPPTAKLGKLAAPVKDGATYNLAVKYADNVLINRSTLKNGNVLVTGPNGYRQVGRLISATPAGNARSMAAIYQVTAPGGAWDRADNGLYTFWLQSKQVRDTQGNFTATQKLGSVKVALAARSRAQRTASAAPASACADPMLAVGPWSASDHAGRSLFNSQTLIEAGSGDWPAAGSHKNACAAS